MQGVTLQAGRPDEAPEEGKKPKPIKLGPVKIFGNRSLVQVLAELKEEAREKTIGLELDIKSLHAFFAQAIGREQVSIDGAIINFTNLPDALELVI